MPPNLGLEGRFRSPICCLRGPLDDILAAKAHFN
jgi:hypothetical protein